MCDLFSYIIIIAKQYCQNIFIMVNGFQFAMVKIGMVSGSRSNVLWLTLQGLKTNDALLCSYLHIIHHSHVSYVQSYWEHVIQLS